MRIIHILVSLFIFNNLLSCESPRGFMLMLSLENACEKSNTLLVEKGKIQPIKFSTLTNFEWDKFFVIGAGYLSNEEIEKIIGSPWPYEADYLDEIYLIIFMKGKDIVAFFHVSAWDFQFNRITDGKYEAFSKSKDSFYVLKETNTAQDAIDPSKEVRWDQFILYSTFSCKKSPENCHILAKIKEKIPLAGAREK